MRLKSTLALIGILALAGCDDFPKDNAETLEHLRAGKEMKVGVAHNPPWVVVEGSKATGVEPALVARWAQSLGTKVHFVPGFTDDLVEALYRRELDVLIVGLTQATPHAKKLALSQPYLTVKTYIGVAPGQTPLADWAGQRIAVDPDRLGLLARISEMEAQPVPLENGRSPVPVMAGYEFELEQRGFEPVGRELSTDKHVIAVIPGESALLLSLDTFLQAQSKDALRQMVVEASGETD